MKKISAVLLAALLVSTQAFAAWDPTKPGNSEKLKDAPGQIRSNWEAIEDGTDPDLQITNDKVSDSAAIVDTKLATISTAGKVTGAALTTLGDVPSGAGLLPLANGGTNANLTPAAGKIAYSGASALALSAAGSSGQIFQSAGTSAPGWTTATYPATAGSSGKILQSDGTNVVSSTPTWPTSASSAGKVVISNGTNLVMSTPTYPNTSPTTGKVLTSDGTNIVASSYTVEAPGSSGEVLTSNGTDYVSEPFSGASGVVFGLTGSATTNHFLTPGAAATTSTERFIVSNRTGTLKNLYSYAANNFGGGSAAITVRINGSDSSLTCTMPGTAGSGNCSDTSNTPSVTAGDRVSVRVTLNPSVNTQDVTVMFDIE